MSRDANGLTYAITGGNRGLGLAIAQHFRACSFSRSTGHDILTNRMELANLSLNYDVFINNAFDGQWQEPWADFGQVKLLTEVAMLWQKHHKGGHIINIGSTGSECLVTPDVNWHTYHVNKVALKYHSRQWSQAFAAHQVRFRTSLITVDRLDTPLGRSTSAWTGNGINCQDIIDWIEYATQISSNTAAAEIVLVCDLDHEQNNTN